LLVLSACGCSGQARVELAAADALDGLAGELNTALDEFHGDLSGADDQREAAVVSAFIERVKRDVKDDARLAEHDAQFREALAKIRADRQVAWERFDTARDNVTVTREVAGSLRRTALAGLALDTDVRQYVERLISARQTASKSASATAALGNTLTTP
jgi:hypothetical protein